MWSSPQDWLYAVLPMTFRGLSTTLVEADLISFRVLYFIYSIQVLTCAGEGVMGGHVLGLWRALCQVAARALDCAQYFSNAVPLLKLISIEGHSENVY
jgi:hypothetical protein